MNQFTFNRNRHIGQEDESRTCKLILFWTLGMWFGVGILVVSMAYEYQWDSQQCNLCNQLINKFPSIDIAASKSNYPNVMRIIWLYLTITTPMSFIGMTLSVPFTDFRQETRGMLWGVCCVFITILLIYSSVIYFLHGGPDMSPPLTKWNKIYAHTISSAYILCFSRFFWASFGPYILTLIAFIFINR